LIKLNYDEKKVEIKNIIQSWSKKSLTLWTIQELFDPLKFYRFVVSIYISDV
jgi:hypothetical protein